MVLGEARKGGVSVAAGSASRDYINTIPVEDEPAYPGNLELERRIRSAIRWNAVMTVLRASKKDLDLGGHMASFQSSATFYEVCFNHFFRARNTVITAFQRIAERIRRSSSRLPG